MHSSKQNKQTIVPNLFAAGDCTPNSNRQQSQQEEKQQKQ